MEYIFALSTVLVTFLLVTILSIIRNIGLSGVKRLYKLLVLDVGYRKETPSIERGTNKKYVLIVGDSTAVGPGTSPKETIEDRLAEDFNVNVINLARNGARTHDIIEQIPIIPDHKFYLTIVHAGNNDIWRHTNLKKLERDIKHLLDRAKGVSERVILFRGGNIGSCPFFPITIGWIFSIRSKKVRNLFKDIADKKSVLYVEKYMERKDDIFLKHPHHYYCWDMLHLNGNGFKVWYDYLLEEMSKANIKL